jgi:hypothetical protein
LSTITMFLDNCDEIALSTITMFLDNCDEDEIAF